VWLSPVEHCVRDAGVAGSNPATPTRLLTIPAPCRDSYRDRNGSATCSASFFAIDAAQSETCLSDALGPSQPILLIIEPVNRRGLFAARLAEDLRTLCTSRTSFTDSARMLLREGIDPNAILISRKAGQDYDSLRSTVGAAAKLTVDETRTVFAKWKAFSATAVASSIDYSEVSAATLAAVPPVCSCSSRSNSSRYCLSRSAPEKQNVPQIEMTL
jgi:hypothetical protein